MSGEPSSSLMSLILHRPFAPYFWGSLASNTGTWAHNVAQSILMYRLTESALMVGVVNFAQFVGLIGLMRWTGPIADRPNRRRSPMITQVVSTAISLVLAVLVAFGAANPASLIGAALLLGAAAAFAHPLQQALLPHLVTREDLPRAVLLNSIAFTGSRMLGAAVSAVVVGWIGIQVAFFFNTCSYVALVLGLWVVQVRPSQPVREGAADVGWSMRATVARVRRRPALLLLFAVLGVSSIAVDPVTTLSPVFASEVYGLDDAWTGLLVGAFGAGALVAAIHIALGAQFSVRALVLLVGVTAAGGLVFAGAPIPAFGLVGLVVSGYCFMLAVTLATVMIHELADDRERGRLMALRSAAFIGPRPFSALADGALASTAGPQAAAALMVVPALALALSTGRFFRRTDETKDS